MLEIAVLASGRGSNLQALWEESMIPDSNFKITSVLSDNADSMALKFAESKEIPYYAIQHTSFEKQLSEALNAYQPSLICLAGFMRILSANFVDIWRDKIINIHPSLLPKYIGLNTHSRAIEAGDKEHGATVHYVTEELDRGKIIDACKIPILKTDTPETLANRLLEKEHELYRSVVRRLAEQATYKPSLPIAERKMLRQK